MKQLSVYVLVNVVLVAVVVLVVTALHAVVVTARVGFLPAETCFCQTDQFKPRFKLLLVETC